METKEIYRDCLIEEKIKAINERIDKIGNDENYSRPNYKTNCNPILKSGERINFKTVKDITTLINAYSSLFLIKETREKVYKVFLEQYNIDCSSFYKDDPSFKIEDYLSDIVLRIKQLILIQEKEKLVEAKSKLEELYSKSKKDDLKFNEILSNIENLI